MHHDGRGPPCRLAKRIPPSTPEGRRRWPRRALWTRFEAKSYIPTAVIGTFMSALLAKPQEPVDETADALADRCVGPKADGPLEVGGVRAGLRNIACLHPKHLPDSLLPTCPLTAPTHPPHPDPPPP